MKSKKFFNFKHGHDLISELKKGDGMNAILTISNYTSINYLKAISAKIHIDEEDEEELEEYKKAVKAIKMLSYYYERKFKAVMDSCDSNENQ